MGAMSTLYGVAVMGAGATIAAFFSETFRTFISKWTFYDTPGGGWRILAIVFAIANLKSLPFVWHARFLRGYFYQLYYQPTPIPASALFQPTITSTRCTLLEMDYNLHKSNSTYFADMDISRTHLFTAIMRRAIIKATKNSSAFPTGSSSTFSRPAGLGAAEGTNTKARHMIALGAVSCLFKKEIKPYAKYEMWTRVLCWDRKWFYLVTHLVRPGVAKPANFSLQPWKKSRGDKGEKVDREKLKGAIYATALAKYVIKEGRKTIAPEQALFDAEMVPAKPDGWVYNGSKKEMNGNADKEGVMPEAEGEEWNWDIIERERLRGLEIAEHFSAMDGLHDVFDGGENGALGEFTDLLF